ncbi:CocE/NonD family hydrolase [Parapedobacter sp. GCM10030251]|uniref:CocE/NonD family hydrolase n=1 Tax=Parapedobacter sp. GCM10030251 TaxID=3273419 RepID=UPI0036132CE0
MFFKQTTAVLLAIIATCGLLHAQPTPADSFFVEQHYTKREVRIPMRDGVHLFTAVYVPKDTTRTYPILFMRTPYSVAPYGEGRNKVPLGPNRQFMHEGFIFVYQDIRGKYLSEGDFVAVRPYIKDKRSKHDVDESSDAYDTIDWLLKNIKGHNGRVGIWGISAPGGYATAALLDAHPNLVAVSPQAPVTDWFMGDDRHHNGAFMLMGSFSFVSSYGRARDSISTRGLAGYGGYGTPDGYDFYLRHGTLKNLSKLLEPMENPLWDDLMSHGTYDAFWKARTPLPHLKNVQPAVLTVGGWFDQEDLYGPLKTQAAIASQSPATRQTFVMGPWYHGTWARDKGDWLENIPFGSATGDFYRETIEFPFFMHHLKGKPDPHLPPAYIFDTGALHWRAYDQWPPKQATSRKLYLQPKGELAFVPPPSGDASGFAAYYSDPNRPVPYTAETRLMRGREYMVEDQRFAARRPDVLVFVSDPLEEPLQIAGRLTANLFVRTTGTDADFIVKLIDVFPDNTPNHPEKPTAVMGGYQLMVRGEVMRAKFRNSFEHPEPLDTAAVNQVSFDMQDAAHTFKKGHRIMVQIQSSWFPLVDRNPQQFMDIYQADATDFKPAWHRVFFTPQYPSNVDLMVIEN